MASDIYKDAGSSKLFYKDNTGALLGISDPAQLQSLAKQGVVKTGSTYLPLPSSGTPTSATPTPPPATPAPTPAPTQPPGPAAPGQPGSNTAFNLAFTQLMQVGKTNQGLQDKKNLLLKQLYDRPLTPDELRTLSPAQQDAIKNGDKSLLENQIMTMNDTIKGRADENTNALQYMLQGYQEDQKVIQDRQTKAFDNFNAMLNKYPQLYSYLSPESVTNVQNGQMPTQADLLKVSTGYSKMQSPELIGQTTDALGNKVNIYGTYDAASGTWKPISGGSFIGGGGGGSNPINVGGYDISSYATDPNHEAKVQNILTNMGQLTSVSQMDEYIKQNAPNSPITGAMIESASKKYGVSWEMLLAMMQQDSSLGTAGKGAKTHNPGNVGNTDSGATKDYGTWQGGVDAVAHWLSNHKAAEGGNPLASPIDEQAAQDLAAGKADPSKYASSGRSAATGRYTNAIVQRAEEINPKFDLAKAVTGFKYANNNQTQQAIVQIDTVLPNIDTIIGLSDAFARKDYPKINAALRSLGYNVGNKNVTNLQELQNIIADELGKALAGNSTLSDAKLHQAQEAVDVNQSPASFASSMGILKKALMNRKEAIWKQAGPYAGLLGADEGGSDATTPNDPLGIL